VNINTTQAAGRAGYGAAASAMSSTVSISYQPLVMPVVLVALASEAQGNINGTGAY
jgi:hypothetical protein